MRSIINHNFRNLSKIWWNFIKKHEIFQKREFLMLNFRSLTKHTDLKFCTSIEIGPLRIKKIFFSWNFNFAELWSKISWNLAKFYEISKKLIFFRRRIPISIPVQNFRSVGFVKPLKFNSKNWRFWKISCYLMKFHQILLKFGGFSCGICS